MSENAETPGVGNIPVHDVEAVHLYHVHHEIERFSRLRRCGRIATAVIGLALASGGGGLVGASADGSEVMIGPHRSSVELSLNGYVTADTGVLDAGRLPLDSTYGLPLGADIRLGGISTEEDEEIEAPTPEELGGGLNEVQVERISSLYAGIEGDIDVAADAIKMQFLKYALITGVGAGALYRLRKELRKLPVKEKIALTLAGSIILGAIAIPNAQPTEREWHGTGDLFTDTPFEGLEVSGDLLPAALPGIRQIVDYFRENDEFYNGVRENLRQKITESPVLPENDDTYSFVFITDLHCNIGMRRVIDVIEADLLIDSGDAQISGSQFEEYCLRDNNRSNHKVGIIGNHGDSERTFEHLQKNGYTVLSGEIEEIEDLRFFGDKDSRQSELGQPTFLRGEETVEEMGRRMEEIACTAEEPIDVAVIHDEDAALPLLRCTKVVFVGHSHQPGVRQITGMDGVTRVMLNGGTSGGAKNDSLTIGPLKSTATITVGQINKTTGELVTYRRIEAEPDRSIVVRPLHVVSG